MLSWEAGFLGSSFKLSHSLAVKPWASHFTILSLDVPIYKMSVKIACYLCIEHLLCFAVHITVIIPSSQQAHKVRSLAYITEENKAQRG